jgi:hypothetical protein
MATRRSSIQGWWRIVETERWDQAALDIVVPAYIRFDRRGRGEMQLTAIRASIDYRVEQRDGAPVLEFSWCGFDDTDATNGRGWARIEGDTMRGKLFIHQGEESTFVATRELGLRHAATTRASRTPVEATPVGSRGLLRRDGRGNRGRGTGLAAHGAQVGRPVATDASRSRAPVAVYQFRITLLEISPPVRRTIQVPGSYSFWDLHVAIQDSMGWLDYHLHLFRVTDPGAGAVVQIGIPDEDAFEGDEPILPGWDLPIARYFALPGAVARYEYDFGDGWEHEITLEAILPPAQGKRYPRCLGGERRCPPEDCGGIGGYEGLLAVIRDPTHREYESTLRWLGGRFDPERFNAQQVTFDNPGKRWEVAFGKPPRKGRRGGPADRHSR